MNIYVHNLVQVHKEFLLGGCLGVELLTHVASIHSTLQNNAELFSNVHKYTLRMIESSIVAVCTTFGYYNCFFFKFAPLKRKKKSLPFMTFLQRDNTCWHKRTAMLVVSTFHFKGFIIKSYMGIRIQIYSYHSSANSVPALLCWRSRTSHDVLPFTSSTPGFVKLAMSSTSYPTLSSLLHVNPQ